MLKPGIDRTASQFQLTRNGTPPPRGVCQVNTDWAIFEEEEAYKIGIIIRDSCRRFLGAKLKVIPSSFFYNIFSLFWSDIFWQHFFFWSFPGGFGGSGSAPWVEPATPPSDAFAKAKNYHLSYASLACLCIFWQLWIKWRGLISH